jgi:uncharacterized protein
MQLSATQQRIIGCLLEKQTTTPEYYPLSLNALTNACNQKSNRDPVFTLTEAEVQNTLDELMAIRIVTLDEGLSGRVNKYSHRFCNTEFSDLQFTEQQRAIICLLLLRGAQTPGELRTRCSRLVQFDNVSDVENALNQLVAKQYVTKQTREPGKRDSRYSHLFAEQHATETTSTAAPSQNDLHQQELNKLVNEIDKLKAELRTLKTHLGL